MNTATVSMAVTPTVLSTFLSHYLNRKPLRERPTAHLSYDEGLHLIRSFLSFASHHTVEDIQAFTSQWVPHPQWVKVDQVEIPEPKLVEAASALQAQLGPDGIRKVGGRNWWQWRKPGSPLKAEWIEMKADYHERKKTGDPGKRVMLYVHGGAYFFGSVDEHRYQMQRHARKLKARVFAPEYRLSPQFPFPCGLQDCLAAYLYLLTTQDPTTIILAGDSAGGGMVLSMLITMRDRGIPLPAGAILISPWVDLTHSFPSVSQDCPLDYIPQCGFHHRPSKAWPPLNADEYAELVEQVNKNNKKGQAKMKPVSVETKSLPQDLAQLNTTKATDSDSQGATLAETSYISVNLDGKEVKLKDQLQMYTTNELLSHPLVSPVMQPTLGGLPPLLIMTGGGEILRDEQIYLAHKCANPSQYLPPESSMHESAYEQLKRFKPTDVQLQVWDDLCHVAPTLSFTRPAKFMYRSIAQFGAWALARAQKTGIEIQDDDDISVISNSSLSSDNEATDTVTKEKSKTESDVRIEVGKAGDPLPPFKNHMIRQRVSRHGVVRHLEPASELVGCTMDRDIIGVVKETPVRRWLETRAQWNKRYGSIRTKIHKKRLKEMAAGYVGFDGETPPPAALASRRRGAEDIADKKKTKSVGLALWSLWGSKHDEATVIREDEADRAPEVKVATTEEGEGARSPDDLQKQGKEVARRELGHNRSRSRTKIVRDEQQTADDDEINESTSIDMLMAQREEKSRQAESLPSPRGSLLTPDYFSHETGVAGKRPTVGGIAVPFTLNKEAETASMITLTSAFDHPDRVASPRPLSLELDAMATTSAAVVATVTEKARDEVVDPNLLKQRGANSITADMADGPETPMAAYPTPGSEAASTPVTPLVTMDGAGTSQQRPPLETFVTAQEDLPTRK
ncbi:AB hydrolase superfamily protein C4A8.06c [Daldinia childiae]|uniref:AB hydrolase superfamily protein C4A8.06c n=1 Tax=Daldinia childiae TaxID=326645 RepID=UPI001448224F|nr:AB hydrolase superfamily protein C4A8.06c [Daldinia childiae]KAF3068487.1 AB hydrolase superfamily protein C4A8.06c [Daldinia childiae]